MTQTNDQSTAALVARYVSAWNETSPEARRGAVSALWVSDGAEFVEGTSFRGHDALFARVTGAHEQFVASGRFTVASAGDAVRHGGIVVFTMQLRAPSEEVAWAARVFLLLDEDGRIREDYQLTVKPLAE
jgi:hypothetical protein